MPFFKLIWFLTVFIFMKLSLKNQVNTSFTPPALQCPAMDWHAGRKAGNEQLTPNCKAWACSEDLHPTRSTHKKLKSQPLAKILQYTRQRKHQLPIQKYSYRSLKLATAVLDGTQCLAVLVTDAENMLTPWPCSMWILAQNLKGAECV